MSFWSPTASPRGQDEDADMSDIEISSTPLSAATGSSGAASSAAANARRVARAAAASARRRAAENDDEEEDDDDYMEETSASSNVQTPSGRKTTSKGYQRAKEDFLTALGDRLPKLQQDEYYTVKTSSRSRYFTYFMPFYSRTSNDTHVCLLCKMRMVLNNNSGNAKTHLKHSLFKASEKSECRYKHACVYSSKGEGFGSYGRHSLSHG